MNLNSPTLTREFADSATLFEKHKGPAGEAADANYSLISNRDELDKLIRQLWETEFWSFRGQRRQRQRTRKLLSQNKAARHRHCRWRGPSRSTSTSQNFAEGEEAALQPLRDIFSNGFLDKTAHDYKRNLSVLRTLGIEPSAVNDDPMLASYLLDTGRSNFWFAVSCTDRARHRPDRRCA